ncbi:MAG: prepilin-type N-terminal cleavage/methylation domain-containing protein [Opitutaceae bacterium]|nr:prepilin-type N-terminal cleavage/methylation domain-containing protein [Opitutaceae bacterium]
MITSTSRTNARRRGFTLVEIMVSTGLSTIVMTGVLSSFILMGKNSYNAANYSVMEAESRRALETFTEEARMASNITWTSSNSVTLSVVNDTSTYLVTYAYDTGSSGSTAKCFYRRLGDSSSTQPAQILVRSVTDFAFRRYKVVNGSDFSAANDLETKQLQITLRTVRTGTTTVNATNAVLSARVVLRNKHVST